MDVIQGLEGDVTTSQAVYHFLAGSSVKLSNIQARDSVSVTLSSGSLLLESSVLGKGKRERYQYMSELADLTSALLLDCH